MPQTPSNGREQRRLTLDDVHVRSKDGGDQVKVRGHAAVWEKPAWIGPPKFGFSERFEKGAFRESINGGADVRYLFNHDPNKVLARTKSGTLTLGEDASGLTVEADLAPTSVGRDLAILMERGDVNQMSVGMQVLEDRWDEIEGGDGNLYERRTIIRAKLFDVSAVTYPAYEETDAGLRDAQHARELRDARGVAVARKNPQPAVQTPPDPPRAARVEVLPDGDLRIHRPDGTTVNVSGEVIGSSVAFDGRAIANGTTPVVATPPSRPDVTISSGDGMRTVSAVVGGGEAPRTWTFNDIANTPEPAPGAITSTKIADAAITTPNITGGASPPQTSPPSGDETPTSPAAGGAQSSPGPATATPTQEELRQEVREGITTLTDSQRSVFDLLQEHAWTQEHRKAPRLKCPACNRPATATETPAARPQ
jgi:HK97 family phage prohead protease